MKVLYAFAKALGRFGLPLFFGKVKIINRSNTALDGAIIFAPNHQGAFADAYLTGAFARKVVHFLTRSDIFKKWAIPFLKGLHMTPIYRIRDGIQNLSQNDQVFELCSGLLANKKSILIFPEGNQSIDYFLRPLSKGVARLAMDARMKIDPNVKIYIIPTGINYFSHFRPLRKVIIKFGEPISLEAYMDLYNKHPQKAYKKLLADLETAMKQNMVLAEKGENYEKKRDWLFQPKHEQLSFDELKAMGDADYYEEIPPQKPGFIRRFCIGFFSIFNVLPLLALKKILSGIKDVAFYISIKLLVGTILHLVWWTALFTIGLIWLGWEAGCLFTFTAIMMAFARQSLIK